jgi:FtsP/CotA-like multicopper oxidase with cupredoxin domain
LPGLRDDRCVTLRRILIVASAGLLAAAAAGCGSGSRLAAPTVKPATGKPHTRVYYVSADTVRWNYAPDGKNEITGEPFTEQEQTYVKRGVHRIGSVYYKSLYREYTDATFTHLKARSPQDRYLGFLGPVIRAEVGDTIKVVFRNATPFPASIHPHGVFYTKANEGTPYNDGTAGSQKADDAVAPGHRYTYVWSVPPRAGPGPMDGSSVLWMYHSHTNEVDDVYSGLVGPMVITRRGMARADGSPKDVDREIFTMYEVADENQSLYLQRNVKAFAGDPGGVDPDDEEFQESNLMHSINGYVYGNEPMITVKRSQRVRWYTFDMGTEVDLHTPHWHGNTLVAMGMRTDVIQLLPGGMITADMRPDDAGTWLFHCHVGDHIRAGMLTRYRVVA